MPIGSTALDLILEALLKMMRQIDARKLLRAKSYALYT